MRRPTVRRSWLTAALSVLLALGSAAAASAGDALAEQPSDLSVTVYRAPERGSGSIRLDQLGGFALVSETRTVHLPAGVNRLRFEGVADGIEPASALVSGLPTGVIEKNREGKLLSPAALLAAALHQPVTLLRTDKKTGRQQRLAGTIRSDAGGVVFETSEGIEALRCSGFPESFAFAGLTDLAATPTLSVLVRSSVALTRTVTLSYLARGFDWSADYTATVSVDGKSMDLGAWVTLANGNGVGFPAAHAQVVAGRVNRESGEVEPIDVGGPILAQCWPRGSTSDSPQYLQLSGGAAAGMDRMEKHQAYPASTAAMRSMVVTAARVEQEQLGDLKLYRVSDRTSIASRQSKQVRLLDRSAIPVSVVYGADLAAEDTGGPAPASQILRTMNTVANHLGLPLPSGRIAVYAVRGREKLLEHESGMRDLAVDEEVEIDMGASPDVQVTVVKEHAGLAPEQAPPLPLVTGAAVLKSGKIDVCRVDISNARAAQIDFELRLRLPEGGRIVRADHPLGTKNGRPIFRLAIPANETVTLRYQSQRVAG
jgi:hypothetical protein